MKHCSRGEGGGNVDMRNKICELHGKLFEPKRQYVNIQSQNDIQWPFFCFVYLSKTLHYVGVLNKSQLITNAC